MAIYNELIKRLNKYSAEHENHGGITAEAADAIEELSKPRWISVTERLPNYGETVLAYGSRGGIFTARFERARTEWGRDAWWKLNSKSHVCNPTHWMPLPQPPEGGK